MNAHPEPFVFHAQVGDGDLDHSYWGPPEFMSMKRPVYSLTITTSGTEPLAEAAAALAAGSIIFREADPEYSDKALGHALELFEFADKYRKERDSRTVDSSNQDRPCKSKKRNIIIQYPKYQNFIKVGLDTRTNSAGPSPGYIVLPN